MVTVSFLGAFFILCQCERFRSKFKQYFGVKTSKIIDTVICVIYDKAIESEIVNFESANFESVTLSYKPLDF